MQIQVPGGAHGPSRRDFPEFLRCTPRQPVAASSSMADGRMESQWPKVDSSRTFDRDAASVFNSRLPLRLWVEAAGSATLPRRLRGEIAQAGWVRAALLDWAE